MNRFVVVALCAGVSLATPLATRAMPPFAQAYGVSCSLCHTQVPGLNAYGRYVQRTGYASLDPHTLRRAFPAWIGVSPFYDSQDPDHPHQVQFGNVALHAVGPISNDWTYHVHQWIVQNQAAGGLDTLWLAYNNLLHRDGHLFFGKIESPGPSAYSQWFDLAAFSTPEITVGEHAYQLDANRWGAKLNYVHGNLDLEAGWFGSGEDLGGTSDFTSDIDKTFMWKAAYADPIHPLEVGLMGSRGSVPLSEGGFDQYSSLGAYAQRDPTNGFPGAMIIYQRAFDGNPGMGSPSAWSTAQTFELYQPIGQNLLLSARKEFTNDGLGNIGQSGNIDLSYQVAPYIHTYVEAALAQNAQVSWRYMVWWTTPIRIVK